jgi:biotin transport system substrate-specific component
MSLSHVEPRTLAERIWPERKANRVSRFAVLALLGALALTLAAKWKVPLYPVSMTMQTAIVFLIGAAYGFRLAVASLLIYLLEGAVGLPVFTDTPDRGIGLIYMLGPTGGYLVGSVLAAGLVGLLAGKGLLQSPWLALPIFLAADVVIFACGVGWLSTMFGGGSALRLGLHPFLYGEALKIALAAALVTAAWRLVPPAPARR